MNTPSSTSTPGVALFDSSNRTDSGGWACLAGSAPFRFESAQALTSAGVWMTNLNFEAFSESRLYSTNRFRGSDYLRTRLVSIAKEIGATKPKDRPDRMVGAQCAQQLATFFGSTIAAAHRLGMKGFPPSVLALGFRGRVPKSPAQSTMDRTVVDALSDAANSFVLSEKVGTGPAIHRGRDAMVQLVLHRYRHAELISSFELPTGSFSRAPLMSYADIVNCEQPLLLKVAVHSTDQILGALLNFGGSRGRVTYHDGVRTQDNQPRQWMTSPEFIYLSQHAVIEIKEVWIGQSYIANPLASAISNAANVVQMSMAFGIAFENAWLAPVYNDRRGRDLTAAAAWVQAYDRVICMREAIDLQARMPDVDITYCGTGRISCRLPSDVHLGAWCAEAIKGSCLIPPLMADEDCYEMDIEDESNLIEIQQSVLLGGSREDLLQIDEAALAIAQPIAQEI